METTKRQPGKFEGCYDQDLAQALHNLSLEGGCDQEIGDVEGFGWYGLMRDINLQKPKDYIIQEDNYGFFDYTEYEKGVAIKA